MSLDPRIEALRKEYDLRKDDFWELPQKRGSYCIKHSALEVVAAKAGVVFDTPQVLEANGVNGVAAICVRGTMGDRSYWSIGEASPKNNKNAYPFAMAEKRAIDRVVLKLVGLHGLLYSEEESDDFKEPAGAPERPVRVVTGKTVHIQGEHGYSVLSDEPTESERKTVALLKTGIDAATTLPDLKVWWMEKQTQSLLNTLPDRMRADVEDHKEGRKADLMAGMRMAG